MEFLAWVGSILLAICGVPMAWRAIREGHAHGVAGGFLWLWYIGELMLTVYTAYLNEWALVFNYSINVIAVTVILRYKLWPRVDASPKI